MFYKKLFKEKNILYIMETNVINSNTNEDNIIAIIDGVVYQQRPKGRPRNPLRWREDGIHITGSLIPGYHREYNREYHKQTVTCEFCGTEIHYKNKLKRHQATKKCIKIKTFVEEKYNDSQI